MFMEPENIRPPGAGVNRILGIRAPSYPYMGGRAPAALYPLQILMVIPTMQAKMTRNAILRSPVNVGCPSIPQ